MTSLKSSYLAVTVVFFVLIFASIQNNVAFVFPSSNKAPIARNSLLYVASETNILSTDKTVKKARIVKPKNYSSSSKLPSAAAVDTDESSPVPLLVKKGKTTKSRTDSSDVTPIAVSVPLDINGDSDVVNSPLILTVYGEPTPLSRHMVSRGHMYNPSAGLQKEFANACLSLLPLAPLQGPLQATLYFYFSRPKNHYGTGKNANVLKPLTASNWHSKRKDLDNLVKFVLDALNAKAYEDDSQIAVIKSAKFYTEGEPYTKVILQKLTEDDYEKFDFEQ